MSHNIQRSTASEQWFDVDYPDVIDMRRKLLDDPADIKQLDPKLDPMKEFRMRELVGYDRFALVIRGMYRAMELNPSLRRADRISLFRF